MLGCKSKQKTGKEHGILIRTVKDLNSIDVSLITDMQYVFNDAKSFNQSLNNRDVSSVNDMYGMFENTAKYSYSMSNWKLHKNCRCNNFLKKLYNAAKI